jgi:hypothetical protein
MTLAPFLGLKYSSVQAAEQVYLDCIGGAYARFGGELSVVPARTWARYDPACRLCQHRWCALCSRIGGVSLARTRSMLAQLNRARTRLVACARRASTGATSEEWKAAGLGAHWAPPDTALTEIVFVQAGMGCDQHGTAGAGKAATRACRQAIEFNALRRA